MTKRISALIATAVIVCVLQAETRPAVEFLFNGSLKNTGTLGGEGKFANIVAGEEARFGDGMMGGCLDMCATRGGMDDRTVPHGGAVHFPAASLSGTTAVTVIAAIYPVIADELPRRIITFSPLLQIYVQGRSIVIAAGNAKNELKFYGSGISVAEDSPALIAVTCDAKNTAVTAYQYKSRTLMKTASESGMPENAVFTGGVIEIGNTGGIRAFKGYIDNVRIYTSVLSAEEIAAVMSADRNAFVLPSAAAAASASGAGSALSADDDFSSYGGEMKSVMNKWDLNAAAWKLGEKSLIASTMTREFAEYAAAPAEIVHCEAVVTFQRAITNGWKSVGIAVAADDNNYWMLSLTERHENFTKTHPLLFPDLNERLGGVWLSESAAATKLKATASENFSTATKHPWAHGTPYRFIIDLTPDGIAGSIQDMNGKEIGRSAYQFGTARAVRYGRPALVAFGAAASFSDVRIRTDRPLAVEQPASPTGWYIQHAERPDIPPLENRWEPLLSLSPITRKPFAKLKPNIPLLDIENLWYRRSYDIPGEWKGRSVWINFEMIEGQAILFVNGRRIKEMLRGDWEAEITDAVTPGEKADVRLYLTRTFTGTEARPEADALMQEALLFARRQKIEQLGLTRDARIFARGAAAWIRNPQVVTRYAEKKIGIECDIGGAVDGVKLIARIQSIRDAGQQPVEAVRQAVTGINRFDAAFTGVPWHLNAPHLYRLTLDLVSGQTVVDSTERVFGFREVRVDGNAVLINGRTNRWRLIGPFAPPQTAGIATNPAYMKFFKDVGFNVIQVQPEPNTWWGYMPGPYPRNTYAITDDAFLDLCDREGIGVTLPLPPVANNIGFHFPFDKKPELLLQYRREMKAYIDRYRHHPCIQAYTIGMNVINTDTYTENLSPRAMGQTIPVKPGWQERIVRAFEVGVEVVKEIDPSVPVYCHAGGSWGGEISGGNQHLNLIPLAEYEKWPSHWAKEGKKPWIADEFACPWLGDFIFKKYIPAGWSIDPKNPEMALTEFSAIMLGDESYRAETESNRRDPRAGIKNLEDYGVAHSSAPERLSRMPAYERFMMEHLPRVVRSFRTFNVLGFTPGWLLEWNTFWEKPEVSDPMARAYAAVMQPLLVYIGGHPEHYTRERNFYSGERISKNIVVVYDGPQARLPITVRWTVRSDSGSAIASGTEELVPSAGAVMFRQFAFTAPAVKVRTGATISITTSGHSQSIGTTDSFRVSIWPSETASPPVAARIIDPVGDSAWLSGRVTEKPDASLVIIGRRALEKITKLPYTADDIAAGMNVLMLEQTPDDLMRLGFRVEERGVRKVFIREKKLFPGIESDDCMDWRGSASLLPEEELPRYWTHRSVLVGMKPQRMTRWGNHGSVSSAVIEVPQKGNIRPLMDCEFDLAYSPLIEWRHGKGRVIFCQLDLTGRVGKDPAATAIASRLIALVSSPCEGADARLSLAVDDAAAKAIRALGFAEGEGQRTVNAVSLSRAGTKRPGTTVVIADEKPAEGGGYGVKEMTAASDLNDMQFGTGTIGPAFMRFRLPLTVNVDVKGSFIVGPSSSGTAFIGVPITAADAGDPVVARITKMRIRALYSRAFSFLGVQSAAAYAERICSLSAPVMFQSGMQVPTLALENAEISVPMISRTSDGMKGLINEPVNENELVWKDLKNLTATSDAAGYGGSVGEVIDAIALFKMQPDPRARVLIRGTVDIPENGPVNFYLGADWWAKLYVDGKLLIDLSTRAGKSSEIVGIGSLELTRGKHEVLMHIVSGSAGFNSRLIMDTLKKPRTRTDFNLDFSRIYGKPMRPYNPDGYSLYSAPMNDDGDPYLYMTW